MFLFPLLFARRVLRESLETLTVTDSSELLLRDGACVAADELYGKLYERVDIVDLLVNHIAAIDNSTANDFSRRRVTPLAPADIFEKFLRAKDALSLCNFLVWRCDGVFFLDSATDTIVTLRPGANNALVSDIYSKLTSAVERLIANDNDNGSSFVDDSVPAEDHRNDYVDMSTSEDEEEVDNDEQYRRRRRGGRGGGGGGGGPSGGRNDRGGGKSKKGDNSQRGIVTSEHARSIMKRLSDNMTKVGHDYRKSVIGGKNNSIRGNVSENSSSDSGQTTCVSGETLDKFVRYMDKHSEHPIFLSLFLNRYELGTPAVSSTLVINYEDSNPPRKFRFNEVLDANIGNFVHAAIDGAPRYFESACSRDAMNHYLYTEIVPQRFLAKTEIGVTRDDKSAAEMDIETFFSTDTQTNIYDDMRETTYDRPFVCEVSDLTNRLPGMFSSREVRNILLSHVTARQVAIILLNFARTFGSQLLQNRDSVAKLANVLVESNEGCSTRQLFAPLACQSVIESATKLQNVNGERANCGTVRRIYSDVFISSNSYFRRYETTRRRRAAYVDGENTPKTTTTTTTTGSFVHDGALFSAACSSILSSKDDRREANSDFDLIMQNLVKARRRLNLRFDSVAAFHRDAAAAGLPDSLVDTATASSFVVVPNFSSNEKDTPIRKESGVLETDTDHLFRYFRPSEEQSAASLDTMRDFLASWRLHEFARDHANDEELRSWINSIADDRTIERSILGNIAVTYLFLLTRERERRSRFGRDGLTEQAVKYARGDSNDDDDDDGERYWCLNLFARLTNSKFSLFDECFEAMIALYPELNIHSYNTNSLAEGLVVYTMSLPDRRFDEDFVCHNIAYGICIAIVTFHIFARGDKDIVLFLLQFITSIRFPGQYLKTVLLLQGTSDSGKSEFVSEVLRKVFSCSLYGTLSNATLRQGIRDEINTDLMSMMKSHLCQCDEPERMNAELFKNLISSTMMKSRYFHQQQSQYLRNLAKLILTVNDAISLRSDAGVITRLKFCLRMLHRFKTLHNNDHDCRVDFTKTNATPSISYQFATRCFAQGVNFEEFRVGVFLLIEHYGLDMCTYPETSFTLYHTICSRLASNWLRQRRRRRLRTDDVDEGNGDGDGDLLKERSRLTLFHKMLVFGLTDKVAAALDDKNDDDDDDDDDSNGIQCPLERERSRSMNLAKKKAAICSKTMKIFKHSVGLQLDKPIRIDKLPVAMEHDARNLHVMIDPFELLQRRYRIVEDLTVALSDNDLHQFLRTFIEESGCNVSRNSFKEIALKIKERIKTEYPNTFDESTQMFHLIFVPTTTMTNRGTGGGGGGGGSGGTNIQ